LADVNKQFIFELETKVDQFSKVGGGHTKDVWRKPPEAESKKGRNLSNK
jgi:hypothetical protein